MKIENITNSVEKIEIKSSKYSQEFYDDAERLDVRKLKEALTNSEYQYIIEAKSTQEQAREKLEKKIKGMRYADRAYLEQLRCAEIKLCYFPTHYMRVDRYKYTEGFDSACLSSIKDFGIKGKKDHYSDLFSINVKQNKKYYQLNGNVGDDARKEKYAQCDVLGSGDINRIITFTEFEPEEGKEVVSAEYQILQTAYCPIWVACVQNGGEDRYTYISDCTDTVDLSMAYNQSELEDISRRLRKPRRFFRKLSNMKFYLWSWAIITAICFVVGMILNVDRMVEGKAIQSISPFIVAAVVSALLHWLLYLIASKTIDNQGDLNPLIDGLTIGETRVKILKELFILSFTFLPMVLTVIITLISKK